MRPSAGWPATQVCDRRGPTLTTNLKVNATERMVEHKCVIGGVGRSGTTFLVALLSALHFDTGFGDSESLANNIDPISNAGLETNPLKTAVSPYIVKDPRFCDYVTEMVDSGRFVIDHVFIPIRSLDETATSRVVQSRRKSKFGGMWKTRHAHVQRAILAETFYGLMEKLTRHEIPFTLMSFPRLVEDADYAYHKLSFLTQSIDIAAFRQAFASVARPDRVHRFTQAEIRSALADIPYWRKAWIRITKRGS
jgi:hypothetical protein